MSKKKKNNFRKQWRTLTEIGNTFGVSARKLGSLLKEHELREPSGEPTTMAIEKEYCYRVEPKNDRAYWLWHGKKVSQYLIDKGVEKAGVTEKEATLNTEARKIARSYMEALQLDEEGNKLGYLMMDELIPEIKKLGIDRFNQALKSLGYKGEEVTLED